MGKRKDSVQKQDLDNAISEIENILEKYNIKNSLVVLASTDASCGAIGGSPRLLAYAIKEGRETKFNGQHELILMTNLLNVIL